MASSSSSSSNFPCAACKFLRRKCMPYCIFAPYFPPEEPQKFFNVHKIFGASNVCKLINEVAPHQRQDAINSLAYEAQERLKDPVYGCVGAISVLQRQVMRLQRELDAIRADLIRYTAGSCNEMPTTVGRSRFDHNTGNFYYPNSQWNSEPYGDNGGSDGGSL
ncbi:LOB domain-containing protein 6 [Hibiscus syriacus]|uniref:LOB domain-containing protein 6 n=1 Tax=Hibiscus syriacus TaxID=106335 RepID=A0A6A2ZSL3_HIBSY|nr:LOB domain-containing protein 25-like [Hibiscus syriacus]KAE8694142.1 LOB domain-containing protein 6 [Hibiscus syriacus]